MLSTFFQYRSIWRKMKIRSIYRWYILPRFLCLKFPNIYRGYSEESTKKETHQYQEIHLLKLCQDYHCNDCLVILVPKILLLTILFYPYLRITCFLKSLCFIVLQFSGTRGSNPLCSANLIKKSFLLITLCQCLSVWSKMKIGNNKK